MFQIASDLRFAIRITNGNRSQIARFGALREVRFGLFGEGGKCQSSIFVGVGIFSECRDRHNQVPTDSD